jgi:hypothetical protein
MYIYTYIHSGTGSFRPQPYVHARPDRRIQDSQGEYLWLDILRDWNVLVITPAMS